MHEPPLVQRVAVETPQHSGLGEPLDYVSEQRLTPGTLVRVPLGKREVAGLVWLGAPADVPPANLRPIAEVLVSLPPLSERWCELVDFAAAYYQRGCGEVALSVLPPELRKLSERQLQLRIAKLHRARTVRPEARPAESAQAAPTLNVEQTQLLEQLEAMAGQNAPPPLLLHGVTGSGKTEIYLRAAAQALSRGRQALVLVPEINLTPQLEARFAERFSEHRIVTLHSALTPAQRLRHWLTAHLGLADLVLGTRLAVFASLPRLGLIVVDEEHDPSYKQQDGARYSARDLAVYRGRLESALVVLGSATPSLESWRHAQTGRYRRLNLPTRVAGAELPQVRLVDMSRLPKTPGGGVANVLSAPLVAALQERLERGEQSLVFLNRRGYAPVLHCTECGWKSGCPHCSAWRVFHKLDRSLRCHHCGLAERVPRACPECGNLDISPIGRGTERLEEQLAALLPQARIARIDADSTRTKGSLEAQLNAVHAGEVDVLVGTQMIAKGHDFRRITLVAAVNPDAALFSVDFRSPERLFALLMQAAGRAGRDASRSLRSEMWVQTWFARHPLYEALRRHDFEAFAQAQLKERESAGLPPYSHLAMLRADARDAQAAEDFLHAAAQLAAALPGADAVTIYPPVPLNVARVADVDRVQMLIEAVSRKALQQFLALWLPALHGLRQERKGPAMRILRWAVDIDPLTI